jgi:toxin ParE1/3/4
MTIKPVIPRDHATHDVENAIDYYLDEEAAQAASDLIDALQAAYRLIGLHPGIGSPRYGYDIERADHIDVVRVLHHRRDIPEMLRDLD